jgi:hypothetical protein
MSKCPLAQKDALSAFELPPADRELLRLIVSGVYLVLRMDCGDYRVQDDAFAEWLRNRELDD